MHHVEPAREARQEEAFLERGVASSDDREVRALEERPVADRAVGDSTSVVLLLARHAELDRLAADGDDDRVGAELGAVLEAHHLVVALAADPAHGLVGLDLEPEFQRMLRHPLREGGAGDRLDARIVLDELGVQDLATEVSLLEEDDPHVGARRIESSGEAGGSSADDDEVELGQRFPFRKLSQH